jgi:hypothetical protein
VTLFESLLLAHILGDWLLQTEWQAMNKARSWRAMLSHVLVYHVVVLAVLVAKLGYRNPYVYMIVASLAISHGILDRSGIVSWLMRTLRISVERPPERWFTVAIDQSIHILLLGLATWVLSRTISP